MSVFAEVEHNPSSRLKIDDVVVEKMLCSGSFGDVYRAVLFDDIVVAVKRPKIANVSAPQRAKLLQEFARETAILASLNHPNIVRLFGSLDSVMIVTEFCELGNLHELAPSLAREQRLALMLDVARALSYLHVHRGIVHCDIKPRNIFVTSSPLCAKLGDFGLARLETCAPVPLCGSRGFMAPELFDFYNDIDDPRAEMIFSFAADIYAFGVTLHSVLTLTDNELCVSTTDEVALLKSNSRPAIPSDLATCSLPLCQFLARLWADCADDRPTASFVVRFLTDLVESLGIPQCVNETTKVER